MWFAWCLGCGFCSFRGGGWLEFLLMLCLLCYWLAWCDYGAGWLIAVALLVVWSVLGFVIWVWGGVFSVGYCGLSCVLGLVWGCCDPGLGWFAIVLLWFACFVVFVCSGCWF